ncbi:MAG: aminotransferase class V-fold PLP-dependent enzyme [Verrucomicrobiales bacterium]|nr:aminotransferase class V-fold PLP-dependent enzyme [Verrucomicrobiales bacterium]
MSDLSKYFDYNATTPMSATAREIWNEASEQLWHNPSSLYREAGYAKQRLDDAREDLADLLGVDAPERVVFTSGATEANNAIVRYFSRSKRGKLAFSAIEHPCVEASVSEFCETGGTFEIPVDPGSGVVDLDALESGLRSGGLSAVSIMAANNETGVLQPWREVAALCREQEIPFHSDAAQWIGKMPLEGLGECDWITGSGHKFGGGKGVGFLMMPEEGGEDFHAAVGGPQEEGRRAGTENLPAILAMVGALEEMSGLDFGKERAEGRDRFEARVKEELGIQIIGESAPRLWNTSMILLPREKNLKWLTRLSGLGFAVSTGSACSAGKGNPSRVMAAMGLDFDEMGRVLRLSGGWESTPENWDALAGALVSVGAEL